jgi:esterase/lipase superfamily enzyme
MEFKIYGHAGPLCLVIPCQDGRFFEWEDRGMFNLVSDLIDQGKVQFVTVDTIDTETWSSNGDSGWRMFMQESWINYLMQELVPAALEITGQSPDAEMMVMGASLGATHAANLFFRFPHRFTRLLALSGVYDMHDYIHDGNYDGNYYQNNPMSYLPNMAPDHPYIEQYNRNKAIFVVGQGPWEEVCKESLSRLHNVFLEKKICPQIYYWGYDTPHDWPSWEKQVRMYLPQLVG